MRNKIMLFVILLISSAFSVEAQNANGDRTSFAILAGVNMQNLNGKDFNGDKLENDLIFGFHAGVNAQIPIVPEFFFQPGLLFSTKGGKNTEGTTTNTINLSYIELPLNLVYKGALGDGYIMLGFGPYLGYGVLGKVTYDDEILGESEQDIEFKNEVDASDPIGTPYYKAFDAGGNIFVSYEMLSGIFLQLNTQFGLIDITSDDQRIPDGEATLKNTGFGLSLGYRF